MAGEGRSSLGTTIGVAAAVIGLTVAQPLATVAAPAVLAALVIEGSSTNPSGAGIKDFFRGKFSTETPNYVNFLTGPFGIWRLLASSEDESNTVMSSGWGAANASLLISYLGAADDPVLGNTTWVLDNNVANPNGGFGTRYPAFAVIGVNPIPTPDDAGTTIISTAYQYDINGNAPKYILNPVSDANSLMAYFNRRLTQSQLHLPLDADGNLVDTQGKPIACTGACTLDDGTTVEIVGNVHTFTYQNGTVARVEKVGDVTYVGYETEHLPLVQPLIDYGGEPGETLANAVEPALEAVVNWGYPDNDPLANPGKLERAGLFPTAAENKKFVKEFVTGVQQGIDSLTADIDADAQTLLRRNAFRQADKDDVVDDSTAVIRRLGPPRPKPISVKRAVKKLSKAFAPKRAEAERHTANPAA